MFEEVKIGIAALPALVDKGRDPATKSPLIGWVVNCPCRELRLSLVLVGIASAPLTVALVTAYDILSISLQRAIMRIMLIQSKSYESFTGGDGLYIDRVRSHLRNIGHDVCTIISDPCKGRPRAWLRLKYNAEKHGEVFIRNTIKFFRFYFVIGPEAIFHLFSYLTRSSFDRIFLLKWVVDINRKCEANWIDRQIKKWSPDKVIILFEACSLNALDRYAGSNFLRLYGFSDSAKYSLNSGKDTWSTFYRAQSARPGIYAAFSSKDERNEFAERKIFDQVSYVGFGYPAYNALRVDKKNEILFIGNKTEPNRQALEFLLRDIWPLVILKEPSARLIIAGRVCSYLPNSNDSTITILGEVKNVATIYSRAKIALAPLVTGSAGVKTKVGEAISFGVPVVATTLGVDKSEPRQLDSCGFISDNPVILSNAIVTLLSDVDVYNNKAEGTRRVFDCVFSEVAAYAELRAWLQL